MAPVCDSTSSRIERLEDQSSKAVDSFFHHFLPDNHFSGGTTSYMNDVKIYGLHSPQVYHAVTAIGCLWILHRSNACDSSWSILAYESYGRSLEAVKCHLAAGVSPTDQMQSLWAILLLGIFELMQDRTGQGFLQHMSFGATRALEQLGPGFFRHGLARNFFLELRVLEISRCMLMSQPSLLARQIWKDLSQVIWIGAGASGWQRLDALLDIMVDCSDFVIRYVDLPMAG
jgi:hypothetical protein